MSKKKPSLPDLPLSPFAEAWRQKVLAEFEIENAHHLELLRAAAVCLDRITACQAAIAKDGLCVVDRFGITKPHPLLGVERDQKTLFGKMLRELGLDLADSELPRGNRTGGQRW